MELSRSEALFAEAQRYIPGGVNSPVRSFRAVGGTPPFIARGQGSHVWDVDGNEYIDYLGSWGPLALGHAHPAVVEALRKAAEGGTSFGAPVEGEVELARLVCAALPSVEMVRLVNSGTEACMSAIRLARAFTGRDKIIKFAGCYHGHADGLLVRAGSGAMTHGIPTSAGVPESYASETLVADFNDLASVEAYFESFPGQIAGIIVEPVAGNMGVVPPADGFLKGLRDITGANDALLIFRRSDHRVPCRSTRCARALRRYTGHYHDGQDHRRRTARGSLRRQAGDHGAGGSPGRYVPGGNALRQPAGG